MSSRYFEFYRRWQQDPHDFWREAAEAIHGSNRRGKSLDSNAGVYGHWFPDATCNTCWKRSVDRHVAAGLGERLAIIYDSPVTGTQRKITYAELLDEVATLAAVLQEHGSAKAIAS